MEKADTKTACEEWPMLSVSKACICSTAPAVSHNAAMPQDKICTARLHA